MMELEGIEGAYTGPLAPYIYLEPATPPEVVLANIRSALARNLPEVTYCKPHGHTLCIAAGGPSIEDTYPKLKGYIVACNGSLRFLLDKGILPYACGVLDPGTHMPDMIVADKRVRYFVASSCTPALFDKLSECQVNVWHASGTTGIDGLVQLKRPEAPLLIRGGCTIALRWFTLGYVLGFRRFEAHGMDSSFRDGATHAYPDRADSKERIEFNGRHTRLNFLGQFFDFQHTVAMLQHLGVDLGNIEIHGDGLLQDVWHGKCSTLSA